MKTLSRKILTYLTLASMGLGMVNPALAGGENLKVSAVLNEGTQTELTPEQVKTIRPWAENSMTFMKQALIDIQGLSYFDKERLLLHAIKNVVLASAPKNSELLMRYVLNRGLKVHSILSANAAPTDKHNIDVRVRVLKRSIELALKYWELDLAYLNQADKSVAPTNFAQFGFEYADFLTVINRSVLDASAQYVIMKTILGFLQWDLYRDSQKTKYATNIARIHDSLSLFPAGLRATDQQWLSYVRKLKKVYTSLDGVIVKTEERPVIIKNVDPSNKDLACRFGSEVHNIYNSKGEFFLGEDGYGYGSSEYCNRALNSIKNGLVCSWSSAGAFKVNAINRKGVTLQTSGWKYFESCQKAVETSTKRYACLWTGVHYQPMDHLDNVYIGDGGFANFDLCIEVLNGAKGNYICNWAGKKDGYRVYDRRSNTTVENFGHSTIAECNEAITKLD